MSAGSGPKFKFTRWVSLSATLGFIVFFLYLGFFTDFREVAIVIGQTNVPIYVLAFVCVLGSIIFNTLTWYRILNALSLKTTFRKAFNLSWVGIFVDSLIPGGWSGDIFKAYLLSKDQEGNGAKATASIIIKNILELLLTLATLIAGIVLLALNYTITDGVIIAIGMIMLFLALPLILIVYLSMDIRTTEKLLKIAKRLFTFIKKKQTPTVDSENKIQNTLREFHDGIMIIKTNPKSLIQPSIFQILAWGFDILTRMLIFVAIGFAISPDKIIITNTVVVTLQTQGIAFAGFAQVASSAIYSVLGISQIVSITSSVLAGLATFWFRTAVAFFFFQIIVFSRCIPFFCKKCSSIRRKNCKEGELPILNKAN